MRHSSISIGFHIGGSYRTLIHPLTRDSSQSLMNSGLPPRKPVDDLTGHSQYGTRFCNLGRHEKLSSETSICGQMCCSIDQLPPCSCSAVRIHHSLDYVMNLRHVEFIAHHASDSRSTLITQLNSALSSRCDLYLDSPEHNSISLGADSLRWCAGSDLSGSITMDVWQQQLSML